MMRGTAGIVVCLAAALLGCNAGDAGPTDPIESSEPEESGDPTEPRDLATPEEGPCDAEVVAAIDATIAGQLEAFAADDFEAAIGFASRSFRSGVDVASFRALIRESYPNLTDGAVHRSGACLMTTEGVAEIRIEVTGEGGVRDDHRYLMVAEDGRWLVAAAVTLDDGDRTLA
jgi:hypothetical protein